MGCSEEAREEMNVKSSIFTEGSASFSLQESVILKL